MADLKETIAGVEQGLADADMASGTYRDDPANWHNKHRTQMNKTAERLRITYCAKITTRGDLTRVRLCGFAASSTGGMASALRNWLAAARKKLAAQP